MQNLIRIATLIAYLYDLPISSNPEIRNLPDRCYSCVYIITLKAPITTAADDIHKYFFFFFFSEKIRFDVSSESSARQRIHMKNQALFSSKDN